MRIVVSSIILTLLLCFSAVFISASDRILNEEEYYIKLKKKFYSKENAEVGNIVETFIQNVDQKYYAGAYYDNTVPELREAYIFVTDRSVVPEIDNKRVHFVLVKYSLEALDRYRAIIEDKYVYNGLNSMYTDIKRNKIEITFFTGTDISKLSELLPADSYEYEMSDETDIDL